MKTQDRLNVGYLYWTLINDPSDLDPWGRYCAGSTWFGYPVTVS